MVKMNVYSTFMVKWHQAGNLKASLRKRTAGLKLPITPGFRSMKSVCAWASVTSTSLFHTRLLIYTHKLLSFPHGSTKKIPLYLHFMYILTYKKLYHPLISSPSRRGNFLIQKNFVVFKRQMILTQQMVESHKEFIPCVNVILLL